MKLKNGVRIREEFRQGYGGPDTWYLRVEWDNRLLLEQKTTSQRELGSLTEKLKRLYGKLSADELRTRAETAKQAHPLCAECGKPCSDGTVSKGVTRKVASERSRLGKRANPTWCSKCDAKHPGVIGVVFRDGTRVRVKEPIAHRPELRERNDNSDLRIPGATGRVVGVVGHLGVEAYLVKYEYPLMTQGYLAEDELQTIPELPPDD